VKSSLVPDEPAEAEPDYRYTLANERTFLAYIRTALGLDAAGLAAVQFLRPSGTHLREGIAIVLVVLGIVVAVLSYRRWVTVDRAMRRGASLPRVHLPLVLGGGLAATSLGALVLVMANR
jgi:putative membrane protein